MEKKRVLFVDDDSDILAGMRRMLRSLRDTYDLFFACGGQEALDLMAETPCHIVISDMRMPGMDGAVLLGLLKQQYPQTIRIMLTGQADEKSVLRTVGVVHQFLAKPCESEHLKTVLARVSTLYDLLNDERLKTVISSVDSLPSLPKTYTRLQELISTPEYSIADVAALIEQDLAMSAKVLQLVNSAFFGLFRHIDSPAHAVSLLGLDTIKSLVLGVQIFSELQAKSSLLSVDQLFQHSVAVGALSRRISLTLNGNKEHADDAFIAGMLHDIGKLLLLCKLPDLYEEILRATGPDTHLYKTERQVLHADHGAVGGYLVGLWGMSGAIVEALCFHHRLDEYPQKTFSPVLAVHLADTLYHHLRPGDCVGAPPQFEQNTLIHFSLQGRISELELIAKEVLGD